MREQKGCMIVKTTVKMLMVLEHDEIIQLSATPNCTGAAEMLLLLVF